MFLFPNEYIAIPSFDLSFIELRKKGQMSSMVHLLSKIMNYTQGHWHICIIYVQNELIAIDKTRTKKRMRIFGLDPASYWISLLKALTLK